MNEKARKKAELPEYMRKSRRMRRILIVVIILLVLILAAMVYFGVQLYKEASSSAVQQALSSEQEVAAIASEDATDSRRCRQGDDGARPGELAGPHPAGGHRHPAARRHGRRSPGR